MPFTNPWSVTVPLGGENANTIDDHIRRLRLDLEERLEQVLVDDMSADPLVLKAGLGSGSSGGAMLGKKILIAHPQWENTNYDGNPEEYARVLTGVEAICAVPIPVGVTIQQVELFYSIGTVGTVTLELRKRDVTDLITDPSVIVDSDTGAGGALALTGLAEVVDGNNFYFIVAEGAGGAGNWYLLGARITYDTPDSTATY